MIATQAKSDVSTSAQFALCVNIGTTDDLHINTIYQVLSDEKAAEAEYLRIVDESGEDYLYPASYFILLDLPSVATEAILMAAACR